MTQRETKIKRIKWSLQAPFQRERGKDQKEEIGGKKKKKHGTEEGEK